MQLKSSRIQIYNEDNLCPLRSNPTSLPAKFCIVNPSDCILYIMLIFHVYKSGTCRNNKDSMKKKIIKLQTHLQCTETNDFRYMRGQRKMIQHLFIIAVNDSNSSEPRRRRLVITVETETNTRKTETNLAMT